MPRPVRRSNQPQSLTSLSSEVINRILSNLDWRSLLRLRLVCKFLRSAIDESIPAQYAIELAAAGMEDGARSQLTTASRLALLKERNACWDELKWGETRDLPPLQFDIMWGFCGGILAHSGPPGALRLYRLPSQYRNIKPDSWRLPILSDADDFAIDPAQDLLALVEKPVLIPTHNNMKSHVRIRIHLRSITTGQVHPSVIDGVRIIHHHLDVQCHLVDLSLQISSNFLGVLFTAQGEKSIPELTVWNWKKGELILTRSSSEIATFAFLTSSLMLVGTVKNEANLRVTEPRLFVLDLSKPSAIKVTLTSDYVCVFGLPPFDRTVSPVDIVIRSDPSPGWKPNPESHIPFFITHGQRLFLITTEVEEKKKHVSYDLFAPANTLLSHVTALPPQTSRHVINWDTWGPTGTRFLKSLPHSQIWTGNVFGSRFVSLITSSIGAAGQPLQTIQMWDFNHLAMKRAMASGLEKEHVRRVNDTTVVKDKVFVKTIRTSLPYSVTTRTLPPRSPQEPAFTDVMCGEDTIFLVRSITNKCHYLRVLNF